MKLRLALCVYGNVDLRWTRIQILAALMLGPTTGLRRSLQARQHITHYERRSHLFCIDE